MTKLKSKKMTKSTFAIIIMAIVIVALLAFGGTFAYFTAKVDDLADGTVTAKTLTLTAGSGSSALTLTNSAKIVPGQTITLLNETDLAKVVIGGDTFAALRISLTTSITESDGQTSFTDTNSAITLSITDATGKVLGAQTNGSTVWGKATGDTTHFYYLKPVQGGASSTANDLADVLGSLSIAMNGALADDDYQGIIINFGLTFEVAQVEYTTADTTVSGGVSSLNLNTTLVANDLASITWTNSNS